MGIQPKAAKCLRSQPSFCRIDKSPRFFFIALTCLATVFVGSAVFYINTHVRVVELGYEITQAVAKKGILIENNKQLALKVAKLKSPGRLEQVAKKDLGLSRPQSSQIIRLSQLQKWSGQAKLLASQETNTPQKSVTKIKKPKPQIKTATKTKTKIKTTQKAGQRIVIAQAKRQRQRPARLRRSPVKRIPAALLDPMP